MLHPVQVIYDHLTHILSGVMGEAADSDEPCSYCRRSAAEYGGKSYRDKDSYGRMVNLCPACQSFGVTDIALMGIERYAAGNVNNPIGNKFGMMPGTGWVYEEATGKGVLLAPPGLYRKLPEAFLSQIDVVEMTLGGHIEFLFTKTFPLIYINNFGRKTPDLIRGLAWSVTDSELVCCTDDGATSTTRVESLIDLRSAKQIIEAMSTLDKKDADVLTNAIKRLASGRITPADVTALVKERPVIAPVYRMFPVDPYARMNIMSVLNKIRD